MSAPVTYSVLPSCLSRITIASDGLVLRGLDRGVVALVFRRADQAPERGEDRRADDRELPVHPLMGEAALLQVLRLEHAGLVMLGGEIADDRVGFPQDEAVGFLQRRHQAVRIHREVGRLPCSCRRRRRHRCACVRAAVRRRAHIAFCTLDDVLRPQILIIAVSFPELLSCPGCSKRWRMSGIHANRSMIAEDCSGSARRFGEADGRTRCVNPAVALLPAA